MLLLLLSHRLILYIFLLFKFSLLFSASTLTVQVPRIICNIQLLIDTNNAFHCSTRIGFDLTVVRHFYKLGSNGIHKNWIFCTRWRGKKNINQLVKKETFICPGHGSKFSNSSSSLTQTQYNWDFREHFYFLLSCVCFFLWYKYYFTDPFPYNTKCQQAETALNKQQNSKKQLFTVLFQFFNFFYLFLFFLYFFSLLFANFFILFPFLFLWLVIYIFFYSFFRFLTGASCV